MVANLKSKKKVTGESLLYAVGRQGNVDELNLPAAGSKPIRGTNPGQRGISDQQPHIFAVGDVIGFPSLGSVSMEQGRIAAAKAFGVNIHSESSAISLRHLHNSGNFVYRENGRATDG